MRLNVIGTAIGTTVLVTGAIGVAVAGGEPGKRSTPVAFVATNQLDESLERGEGNYSRFGPVPAGRLADVARMVAPGTVETRRTLDPGRPGGDTIAMLIRFRLPEGPPPAAPPGRWRITSGTGRYEDLRGGGKHVAIFDQETRTGLEALAGKLRRGR